LPGPKSGVHYREKLLAQSGNPSIDDSLFSLLPSDHKSELTGKWDNDGKMIVFGTADHDPLERIPFSLCTNTKCSVLIEGPRVDEFRRVYQALLEKRRQMLNDWINVIAMDAADLGGQIQGFDKRLISVLQEEDIREVSAVLLVHRTSLQYHSHIHTTLSLNPIASRPIIPQLEEILAGDVYWA